MAALRDLIAFVLEMAAHSQAGEGGFDEHLAREIERQVQGRFPGDRVYIAPSGRRNDPERPVLSISNTGRRRPKDFISAEIEKLVASCPSGEVQDVARGDDIVEYKIERIVDRTIHVRSCCKV
jgi:hypothetical protein